MVQVIEFSCTSPAVCRLLILVSLWLLFRCSNRGYVHLSLFQSKGWTSRSKGITIAKYIICRYSFCQWGSAESDQSHKEMDETWSIHKVGRIGVSWDTNDLLLGCSSSRTSPLPPATLAGARSPRKVGSRGGPDCEKLCLWVDR